MLDLSEKNGRELCRNLCGLIRNPIYSLSPEAPKAFDRVSGHVVCLER